MNAEERGGLWVDALIEEYDALVESEPWPNRTYIDMHGERFSPLVFLCFLNRPIDGLLARGADPLALGWQKGRCFRNAYQACANAHAGASFKQIMHVTSAECAKTLLQTLVVSDDGYKCDCNSKFHTMLMEVVERTARLAAVVWSLLQLQREDLIEPVLQRIVTIPLEEWTQATAPREALSPVSKKIKI
jgi:hypothetical protein